MTTRTPPLLQDFSVRFHYAVHTTRSVFAPDNPLLRDTVREQSRQLPARIAFVVDDRVAAAHPRLLPDIAGYCAHHADVLTRVCPAVLLPGGEAAKNDRMLVDALHALIDKLGLCRHSYLAAVGGGAVIDLAGFAAATAHRGIRLIRLPTTVLAQGDAGVGVKNGINGFGKKNFIGTFAPPAAVINDSTFLRTLNDRDWRAGLAEALKVALLKDARFFEFLEARAPALLRRDLECMERVIHRCAALHLAHIAGKGDPFERGSSRPLDFGHWAAHKLEQLTDHRLRHGEAVAIGIGLDTTYSHLAGLLDGATWQRVLRALSALGFALFVPELEQAWRHPRSRKCVLSGLDEFREHLGGRLTVTLLRTVGEPVEVHDMDPARVKASVDLLQHHSSSTTGGPVWLQHLALAR